MNLYKLKINVIFLAIYIAIFSASIYAQFVDPLSISLFSALSNTGEKPQSKVWYHDDDWWAVIPVKAQGTDPEGAWLYRLNGNAWDDKLIRLSTKTNVNADAKAVDDITYILIFDDSNDEAEFVRIQYSEGSYSIVNGGPTSVINIPLDTDVETATIDVDSNNKVWLASDERVGDDARIHVRYSVGPNYTTWSLAKTLATDPDIDDICAITAFNTSGVPKIGVLWSNQNDNQFHFSYHKDFEVATTWHGPELASPNAGHTGGQSGSFSDDHINLAVSSDGTIYAAVKTSLDADGETHIALLERQSGGTWNVYDVTNSGATRPIALLYQHNSENYIFVLYTKSLTSDNDIVYKYSSTSSISFSTLITLDDTKAFNDVTSTKQICNDEAVILYSASGDAWYGKKTGGSLPVELAFFSGRLNENIVELRWRTETEVNNYGFDIESTKDNSDWLTIGFVEGHGNSNSPKQYNFSDTDINQSGTYNYRLKQVDNDGTYEYSDVVSVEVGVPNNFYLSQNYPNPFNPETRIDFTLPEKQFVTIRVYNTLGEQVAELVNEEREAGSYSVTFDASRLPSGVYIYRLQTLSFAANKKMTLLK